VLLGAINPAEQYVTAAVTAGVRLAPGMDCSPGSMIGASARKRAQSTRERADFPIMSLPEPGAAGWAPDHRLHTPSPDFTQSGPYVKSTLGL